MRKILLVTGASAGIGAAAARLAATKGYDLALNYNSDRAGAEAVAADAKAAGARTLICQADVADPEQINAMFAAIDSEFGRLDALINNAGIVDQTALPLSPWEPIVQAAGLGKGQNKNQT